MSKEHYYDIIKSPAITEKGTLVSEKNQVVFNVARDATKPRSRRPSKASSVSRSRPSTRWSARASSAASVASRPC